MFEDLGHPFLTVWSDFKYSDEKFCFCFTAFSSHGVPALQSFEFNTVFVAKGSFIRGNGKKLMAFWQLVEMSIGVSVYVSAGVLAVLLADRAVEKTIGTSEEILDA
jgi:hypothetical protein